MIGGGESFALRIRERFDWALFIAAALVAVIGVVNLYSATSVYTDGRSQFYVGQVYWLVAGGIVAVVVATLDYRHFERLGYVIYTAGVLMLMLVFVLGKGVRGSARWIGAGSFQFQPSEFTKLALAIVLAKYLHDDVKTEGRTLRDLWRPAALAAVPIGLIIKQPDLGTAIIHAAIFGTIVAMTRLRWKSVVTALVGGLGALVVYWNYLAHDYQKARITSFLNPEADIRGAGWHAHHARVAIGNGGLFGQGFLQGTQNQYKFLPDQFSDFPFPVFAEDWGFVGGVLLVGLYAFLSLWAIRIASQARDRFGAVLSIGVGAMIFWHAFINLGMVTGILPVVGVTLPLFSYGGSSAITILIGLGLLMSVSMRRHQISPVRRDDVRVR